MHSGLRCGLGPSRVGWHGAEQQAPIPHRRAPTERAAEAARIYGWKIAPCGGAWANVVRAKVVRWQPEPIAAEPGALWIASPARPYRCQRSRSKTSATQTIARSAAKRPSHDGLGSWFNPSRDGLMRASPQPEEGQDGQNDD